MAFVAATVCCGFFLIYALRHERTDNAYVAGTIVPVSSEIKGKVVAVLVNDNQYVKEGAPLLEIFRGDYVNDLSAKNETILRLQAEKLELQASIDEKAKTLLQARAGLKAANSEEELAAKESKRYEVLVKDEAVSQSHYDHVASAWKVAYAQKESALAFVAAAEAALKAVQAKVVTQESRIKEIDVLRNQSQLDLTRTTVRAPASGWIAMKNVDPGKYVTPGQYLLAIVKDGTWIVANFKETQIKKMTIGQPADIEVDAYGGVVFKGHVDSLQSGTGAVFSLLPPQNATGNFIKVVQRIPVKIVLDSKFDPDHPLWPGLSVVPSVDISRPTGAKLK